MATCTLVRVVESSQRGEARRQAVACATRLGFDSEHQGRVAIVATELAGNLIKHAPNGGNLFIGAVVRRTAVGIEIVALDGGPGIADEREALRDGYSTAGSPGTGLGAVSRLSDSFELYSSPEQGTVVVSRIWRDAPIDPDQIQVGGVCGMLEGETVSGDDFAVLDVEGRTRIVLADGLGHGPGAAEASASAVAAFLTTSDMPLEEVLQSLHQALRPTRGAAVALAEISPRERIVRFAGLGNISAVLTGNGKSRALVSNNGTVGHVVRRIQEYSYEIPPAAQLILHSDGITGRWSASSYGKLAPRDPALTAALLYRDFHRGRDDATAVVARIP